MGDLMVLGIGNQDKVEERRFNRQMDAHEEENATQMASKLLDAAQVSYDAQVSGKILEVNRRFLNWNFDNKGNMICDEKYRLKEPYMDESLSFLTEEERLILNQIDNTLAIIYSNIQKYENDELFCSRWVIEFNQIVSFRQSWLINSRTTGKPVKVAKSQYVQTEATINRGPQVPPQKPKAFGLF